MSIPPAPPEFRPQADPPPAPPLTPPTAPPIEPPPTLPLDVPAAPPVVGVPGAGRRPWPSRVIGYVARMYEVGAVLAFLGGGAWAFVMLLFAAANAGNAGRFLASLVAVGVTLLWVTLVAGGLFVAAQWLRMTVLIEENTRQTAEALRALQATPPATRPGLESPPGSP
ncbi:MAG: hypothetical protein AAF589_00965 [Planctomycetota bacterium]